MLKFLQRAQPSGSQASSPPLPPPPPPMEEDAPQAAEVMDVDTLAPHTQEEQIALAAGQTHAAEADGNPNQEEGEEDALTDLGSSDDESDDESADEDEQETANKQTGGEDGHSDSSEEEDGDDHDDDGKDATKSSTSTHHENLAAVQARIAEVPTFHVLFRFFYLSL